MKRLLLFDKLQSIYLEGKWGQSVSNVADDLRPSTAS
jgi:hypothetical protein